MANRQVLPTLDLRSFAERQGVTKTQQTVQAIAGILQTAGQAEQARRESQTLDRIARAVASGATNIEAISAVARQGPEFGRGVPGALQRFAGGFQPSPGGIGRGINQAILGQTLQRALAGPAEPFTLTPGAGRFTGAGVPIAKQPAIPRGPLVTVQTGAIEKGTRGQIEKDVIDLQSTLGELEAIDKDFDADFFTFRGRGKAFFTALAEKAEIPVGKAQVEFLSKKTKFFADAKRVFLKFRKFITGVAGGIEEFKEIAKATIDPESDSPTQFQAKMKSMRDNAVRVSNLLLAIRNSGLDGADKAVFKDALSIVPFSNIPLEVDENITLESLVGQGPQKLPPGGMPEGIGETQPEGPFAQQFGKRADGTQKGNGFLGALQIRGGGIATEYSVGVKLEANNGQETEIPSLVPTLTKQEIDLILNDIIPNQKPVPPKILQKAVDHANKRVREGKSPFAQQGEQPGVLTATNPATGEKIVSTDGGQTWRPQ